VHDQNGIRNFALRLFIDPAESAVMNSQLRQSFTGSEFEILDRVIAFSRRRVVGAEGSNAQPSRD
jgi:hypothetical protein